MTDKKTNHQARFKNLFAKGTEALQNGAVSRAVKFLEQAHHLQPEHNDAALNLSGAYILSKKFKKAVRILEPLRERDPHNPMVWTNLGAAYLGNPVLADDGDQQQAIAAFERALDLNPVTPNVAYNLGLIHHDRKEFDRALHWFKKAVQANPNDRDARRYITKLKELTTDSNIN